MVEDVSLDGTILYLLCVTSSISPLALFMAMADVAYILVREWLNQALRI